MIAGGRLGGLTLDRGSATSRAGVYVEETLRLVAARSPNCVETLMSGDLRRAIGSAT
jgi:hypothetical protein